MSSTQYYPSHVQYAAYGVLELLSTIVGRSIDPHHPANNRGWTGFQLWVPDQIQEVLACVGEYRLDQEQQQALALAYKYATCAVYAKGRRQLKYLQSAQHALICCLPE